MRRCHKCATNVLLPLNFLCPQTPYQRAGFLLRTVDFTVFCFSKLKPHIKSQSYTSLLVFYLHVCVFCLHVHMWYHVCAWCLQRPEEGMRPYVTGVRVCKLHVGAENRTRAALQLSHCLSGAKLHWHFSQRSQPFGSTHMPLRFILLLIILHEEHRCEWLVQAWGLVKDEITT